MREGEREWGECEGGKSVREGERGWGERGRSGGREEGVGECLLDGAPCLDLTVVNQWQLSVQPLEQLVDSLFPCLS